MANTFVNIASTKLTSTTANITFSNIPQTYTDLSIYAYVKTSEIGINDFGTLMVEFNSTAGVSYNTTGFYKLNTGTNTYYTSSMDGGCKVPFVFTSGVSASLYSPVTMYIGRYSSASKRTVQWKSGAAKGSTSVYVSRGISTYENAEAITSVKFYPITNSLASGTEITLYGIKNS